MCCTWMRVDNWFAPKNLCCSCFVDSWNGVIFSWETSLSFWKTSPFLGTISEAGIFFLVSRYRCSAKWAMRIEEKRKLKKKSKKADFAKENFHPKICQKVRKKKSILRRNFLFVCFCDQCETNKECNEKPKKIPAFNTRSYYSTTSYSEKTLRC